MAESKLPYINAYGNITKVLNKIKEASTPPRFTHDFLGVTLSMTGGSVRPVVPFLKRVGFLGSDGVPTELYKRFRNASESGAAVADAVRTGYKPLYEMNESVHDLSDADLKGLVVQATGLEKKSSTVRAIVGSFKALCELATFGAQASVEDTGDADEALTGITGPTPGLPSRISLGYTINLHLPATSDIGVFNAIFKSLREHLLKE